MGRFIRKAFLFSSDVFIFAAAFLAGLFVVSYCYAEPLDIQNATVIKETSDFGFEPVSGNVTFAKTSDILQNAEIKWQELGKSRESFSSVNILLRNFEYSPGTFTELVISLKEKGENAKPIEASIELNRDYKNEIVNTPFISNKGSKRFKLSKIEYISLSIFTNSADLNISCIETQGKRPGECGDNFRNVRSLHARKQKPKKKNQVLLKATVTGKDTGYPVYGAKVSFVTFSGVQHGNTDARGEVSAFFSSKQVVALSITAEGYSSTTTKSVKMNGNKTLKVKMKRSGGDPLPTPEPTPQPTAEPTHSHFMPTNTPTFLPGTHTATPLPGTRTPTPIRSKTPTLRPGATSTRTPAGPTYTPVPYSTVTPSGPTYTPIPYWTVTPAGPTNTPTPYWTATASPMPVAINFPAKNWFVTADTEIEFILSASGTGPFSYQWFKNDVEIPGATSSSYTIVTKVADSGTRFNCRVSNVRGSLFSNYATITIGYAVQITSQPQDVRIKPYNTLSFYVAASGNGPFTYQWRRNGQNISGAPNSGTYSFYGYPENVGDTLYTISCVVSNQFGSVTSREAQVDITPPGT
jgi:hypothetical protein